MTTDLIAGGVTHRLGGRLVLDHIDLAVPAGRVVGLLGPNGAGKTTLMRILFGVLSPDEGTVTIGGRPATVDDQRRWGYMPQERGLYRDMRVHDQLTWIARLHGLDRRAATARASDLLERLGLADRGRDPLQSLSGGMAQRVQLAAAMVHEPPVLVLDEPFAGLDPIAVEFLTRVIREHVAAGRVLLLSTHQLDLAESLCERIVLVDRGRIVLSGDLRALKAASADRYLRVDVPVDGAWLEGTGTRVDHVDTSGSRLRLAPGDDPAAILDRVRSQATVTDFGVDTPTLNELFLAAAGHEATAGHEAAA